MKHWHVAALAAVAAAVAATGPPPRKATLPPPSRVRTRIVAHGIEVRWEKPERPGPARYEVVRATTLTGPFISACTAAAPETSCTDTTAQPENIYFYKVRAVSDNAASAWSREATAEMPGR